MAVIKIGERRIIIRIDVIVYIVLCLLFFYFINYRNPEAIIKRNDADYFLQRVEKGKITADDIDKDLFILAIKKGNAEIIRKLINMNHEDQRYFYDRHDVIRAISYLNNDELKKLYFSVFKKCKDGFLKIENFDELLLEMDKQVMETLFTAGVNPNKRIYIETGERFIKSARYIKTRTEYRWTFEHNFTYRPNMANMVLKPFTETIVNQEIPLPVWFTDQEIIAAISGPGVKFQYNKYKRGTYPLLQAVEKNAAPVVKILLKLGADPQIVGDNGETVFSFSDQKLSYLIRSWGKNLSSIEKIIVKDDLNSYIQHLQPISSQVGENTWRRDLETAVENGSAAITAYLLDEKQVQLKKDNWKLLLQAYESRNPYLMDLILAHGMDPHTKIQRMMLPEKYHPAEKSVFEIMALGKNNREIKTKEEELAEQITVGKALMEIAKKEKQMAQLFVLKGHFYQWNDFFIAVLTGQYEAASKLLQSNPNLVNEKDQRGYSPLTVACSHGQKKTVAYLIKNGSDVNQFDHSGFPALFRCIYDGNIELVKLLVENNAALFDQNHKTCASAVFLAEKQYKRNKSIEKVMGAYRQYQGNKDLRAHMRYREVFQYLTEKAKTRNVPLCQ